MRSCEVAIIRPDDIAIYIAVIQASSSSLHRHHPSWNYQRTLPRHYHNPCFGGLSPIYILILPPEIFPHFHVVYELTDRTYVSNDPLAITAIPTKVTWGRLLLMRIGKHKRLPIENLMELQSKNTMGFWKPIQPWIMMENHSSLRITVLFKHRMFEWKPR